MVATGLLCAMTISGKITTVMILKLEFCVMRKITRLVPSIDIVCVYTIVYVI